MKKLLLILLMCLPLFSQDLGTYTVERKSTLAASAEVVTVRLASDATAKARLVSASVYSSVELEVTLERDGKFVSGTGLTENERNPDYDATAAAVATYGTNISGTTVIGRQVVNAGSTVVFDLLGLELSAAEAFTVRTASGTGTVIVNVQWSER